MDHPELPWNAAALRQRLEASWPGITVEIVGSTGSTNTDLLARGRSGAAGLPCLRVAELQTAGRGRQGRTWHAERGASLTEALWHVNPGCRYAATAAQAFRRPQPHQPLCLHRQQI
jgi:hypothetical protein